MDTPRTFVKMISNIPTIIELGGDRSFEIYFMSEFRMGLPYVHLRFFDTGNLIFDFSAFRLLGANKSDFSTCIDSTDVLLIKVLLDEKPSHTSGISYKAHHFKLNISDHTFRFMEQDESIDDLTGYFYSLQEFQKIVDYIQRGQYRGGALTGNRFP